MDFAATIAKLCAVPGVSGYEMPVCELMRDMMRPYCDQVDILPLGSVVGQRAGVSPDAPRVLLDAHLDQIGFIVSGINDEGFLHFTPCGGFDARVLPAKEVIIHTDPVRYGVIAVLPPHLQTPENKEKAMPMGDLIIDAGMSAEEARKCIPIGTPVTVAAAPFALGSETIGGAALDDRACMASILYALELLGDEPLPVNLIIVGSVREETGGAGASTAAYFARPDYAVAVDVTHAHTPDALKSNTVPAGSGACIGVGPHLNRKVTSTLRRLAAEQEIAHTIEVLPGRTGTNATPMQIVRTGVATGLVSLPLRYMHTTTEVIRIDDTRAVGELLAAFIRSFAGGEPRC